MTVNTAKPMCHVITLDGPAGSGKSTVAKHLAKALGWVHVSTGALYRALAFMLMETKSSYDDNGAVERFVAFIADRFRQDPTADRVFLGEREVTQDIRLPAVSEAASHVAQNPLVRQRLLPIQRRVVLECNGAIVDGRDMGTVVFPDAPLKIFLTASPTERAKRRMNEMHGKGLEVDVSSLAREIDERDERDANRTIAPMVPAVDAVFLDSTALTTEQVVSEILRLARERGLK